MSLNKEPQGWMLQIVSFGQQFVYFSCEQLYVATSNNSSSRDLLVQHGNSSKEFRRRANKKIYVKSNYQEKPEFKSDIDKGNEDKGNKDR